MSGFLGCRWSALTGVVGVGVVVVVGVVGCEWGKGGWLQLQGLVAGALPAL